MTDQEIFKKGSTTYYWSSVFFPKAVRDDVFRLYGFVRIADDFVDSVPSDAKGFERLARLWNDAHAGRKISGSSTTHRVVRSMAELSERYAFDAAWTDAFLSAMRADVQGKRYKTLDDTLAYIYGSAEVIGLMMSKIMGLPLCTCHASGPLLAQTVRSSLSDTDNIPVLNLKKLPKACRVTLAARMQGRAMQYINFIRDIDEDIALGRAYFPKSELSHYGLSRIDHKIAISHPAAFREFIQGQLQYYRSWQQAANAGFRYIPHGLKIALRTAADMYNWTGQCIAEDPFIVFEKKVKPSKFRVVRRALARVLHA